MESAPLPSSEEEKQAIRSSPIGVEECANWSQLKLTGVTPCSPGLLALVSVSVLAIPTKRDRDDSDGSTPASLKGSFQP